MSARSTTARERSSGRAGIFPASNAPPGAPPRSGEGGVRGLDSPFRYLLDIARMTGDAGKTLAVLDAMGARAPRAADIDRARDALRSANQTQESETPP
ncbi:MAG: hypothetical protein IPP94_04465 [Ignavibacteria bacterium]|nr:hypothetical protein [Ignavibacteria bacterium]